MQAALARAAAGVGAPGRAAAAGQVRSPAAVTAAVRLELTEQTLAGALLLLLGLVLPTAPEPEPAAASAGAAAAHCPPPGRREAALGLQGRLEAARALVVPALALAAGPQQMLVLVLVSPEAPP